MKLHTTNYVTPDRAALLLGISEDVLLQISRQLGFGHVEYIGSTQQTFFTYEEIGCMCMLSSDDVN